MEVLFELFLIGAGVFVIIGSYYDWDWLYELGKDEIIFSRKVGRIVSVILGMGSVIIGFLMLLDVIEI